MNLAAAELSFSASNTLGVPYDFEALETILQALKQARSGGGVVKPDGSDILQRVKIDLQTSREVDLRRLRIVASKAAAETVYYQEVFAKIGLDPARLTWEDMSKIPITPKEHLRDRPNDFVCKSAKVAFRTTTHSTTGLPTNLCFSQREIKCSAYLSAIFNAMVGDYLPDDIALNVTPSRSLLANLTGLDFIAMLDSTQMSLGQVEPSSTYSSRSTTYQEKRPK
jgi:hypothetical protein